MEICPIKTTKVTIKKRLLKRYQSEGKRLEEVIQVPGIS